MFLFAAGWTDLFQQEDSRRLERECQAAMKCKLLESLRKMQIFVAAPIPIARHLRVQGIFPRGEVMEIKRLSIKGMRLGALVICGLLASGAIAQETVPATPPVSSGSPTDSTAPTTATTTPPGTMSKGELKDQRKQQKRDEKAAKENAKAAKASAKSKEANDKALQAQEKAGQVTPTTTTTAPPQ
jgi:hypothetical protein